MWRFSRNAADPPTQNIDRTTAESLEIICTALRIASVFDSFFQCVLWSVSYISAIGQDGIPMMINCVKLPYSMKIWAGRSRPWGGDAEYRRQLRHVDW